MAPRRTIQKPLSSAPNDRRYQVEDISNDQTAHGPSIVWAHRSRYDSGKVHTEGMELLSTCAEAALVVTVLLATARGAGARAARMGTGLVARSARENILYVDTERLPIQI